MAQLRKFSSIGVSPWVTKCGFQIPSPFSPNSFQELYRSDPSSGPEYSRKAFSQQETKHNFAVRALKTPSLFARRPYVYLCVRCRQIFLVNEHRGSIVAIDRDLNPLPEPENSRRVETFAEGPCRALKSPLKFRRRPQPATTASSGILKLCLLRILASLCPEFRGIRASQPPASGLRQCSRLRLKNFFFSNSAANQSLAISPIWTRRSWRLCW